MRGTLVLVSLLAALLSLAACSKMGKSAGSLDSGKERALEACLTKADSPCALAVEKSCQDKSGYEKQACESAAKEACIAAARKACEKM